MGVVGVPSIDAKDELIQEVVGVVHEVSRQTNCRRADGTDFERYPRSVGKRYVETSILGAVRCYVKFYSIEKKFPVR